MAKVEVFCTHFIHQLISFLEVQIEFNYRTRNASFEIFQFRAEQFGIANLLSADLSFQRKAFDCQIDGCCQRLKNGVFPIHRNSELFQFFAFFKMKLKY